MSTMVLLQDTREKWRAFPVYVRENRAIKGHKCDTWFGCFPMQMKGVTPHAILKETDQIYVGKYRLVISIQVRMQLCATGNIAVCIFCLLSLSNVLCIRLGKAEEAISEFSEYL